MRAILLNLLVHHFVPGHYFHSPPMFFWLSKVWILKNSVIASMLSLSRVVIELSWNFHNRKIVCLFLKFYALQNKMWCLFSLRQLKWNFPRRLNPSHLEIVVLRFFSNILWFSKPKNTKRLSKFRSESNNHHHARDVYITVRRGYLGNIQSTLQLCIPVKLWSHLIYTSILSGWLGNITYSEWLRDLYVRWFQRCMKVSIRPISQALLWYLDDCLTQDCSNLRPETRAVAVQQAGGCTVQIKGRIQNDSK